MAEEICNEIIVKNENKKDETIETTVETKPAADSQPIEPSTKEDGKKPKQKQKKSTDLFAEANQSLSDLVATYSKILDKVRLKDEKIKKLNGENEKLKSDIQEENATSRDLRKKNQDMTTELARRDSSILNLNNKLQEKEKNILSLQNDIAHLKDEIAGREEVINISNKNGSQQAEELKNKIASLLKLDFQDFKDSVETEMSVELGENYRYQIENIFNILKSLEIPVE